jgi:hypothetical protein
MNNLDAEHLPWRVAALAGLIVGGISLVSGSDVWTCLLRVGAAFLVFALAGLLLRAVMRLGVTPSSSGRPVGQHMTETDPAEAVGAALSGSTETKPEVLNSDSLK